MTEPIHPNIFSLYPDIQMEPSAKNAEFFQLFIFLLDKKVTILELCIMCKVFYLHYLQKYK